MTNSEKYSLWLEKTKDDPIAQKDLLSVKDNQEKIDDRFFKELEFGTAGLRGKLGYGTNYMNSYIIRRTTQGLSNYLNKHYKNPSVVIAYDSRNFSKEFASESASVLAANNIKVYLFSELTPVPVLSFSVKYLKCTAGIAITASHNPKEYNGYKVYGDDGAQIGVEVADEVINEIKSLDYFKGAKVMDINEAIKEKRVSLIFEEIFDKYIPSTMKESIIPNQKRNLNIIYTPLHGSGLKFVTKALELDGFNNVHVVEEQRLPDGNFPTANYPNPETKEALALGIRDLEKYNADILLGTDPDADRVGVAIKDKKGIHILTGNEVGILLFDFIYNAKKELGNLPKNPVLVKSLVSSDLVNIMGNKYEVEVRDVLTGFKFIGEQIKLLDAANEKERYLLGFEESCGYLTNIDVRDKDSINACLLIAEMADYYKKQGISIYERIEAIYNEFGLYTTKTVSYAFEGESGKAKMDSIMDFFKGVKNDNIFKGIVKKYDYQKQEGYYGLEGKKFDLPKADVIKYWFKDNSSFTIRPSGTEPKIKFYYFVGPVKDNDLEAIVAKVIGK